MCARKLLGLLLLVAAAGVTACGGDGGTPDAGVPVGTCAGVTLQVGTGYLEYTVVSPGDTVPLFRGPQGGYMLYIGVRAAGIDPADATLCYRDSLTADGTNIGEGCWKIQMPNDLGGGVHERVGVWAQISAQYWTNPGFLGGKDVQVDVTLTDSKGCSASGGWSARVSPDPPM